VGTLISNPIATPEAMAARYTNQGAATGGFCFHSNVNGMWLLKECLESWNADGRSMTIADLVQAAARSDPAGIINVDGESLLLSGDMPERINHELKVAACQPIRDIPGNEARFARVIFDSLAARYATALADLEQMFDRKLSRIHIIGGASRNQFLADLTSQRTGIPVECGHPESSTIGNFAVQLAGSDNPGHAITRLGVRQWASRICASSPQP
jgi:rhamnulokinase